MTLVNKITGWDSVLADIENDIRLLREHRDIVKRKIERGEPWPLAETTAKTG